MGSKGSDETLTRPAGPPRHRVFKIALIAAGAIVAAYFAQKAPRDQHLRLVLGPAFDQVTGLEIQYVGASGDLARSVRMAFDPGPAPRVISHEPQLPDGDYRLRIDLDTREGRRSTERRVSLGGGTTQVDLAGIVSAPVARPEPRTAP